jgi:ActR/RegA family two-component response regulator
MLDATKYQELLPGPSDESFVSSDDEEDYAAAAAALRDLRADGIRIVMLTGYGNLATAVAAVKAGAVDYLAKPADPEDIVRALSAETGELARMRSTSNVTGSPGIVAIT